MEIGQPLISIAGLSRPEELDKMNSRLGGEGGREESHCRLHIQKTGFNLWTQAEALLALGYYQSNWSSIIWAMIVLLLKLNGTWPTTLPYPLPSSLQYPSSLRINPSDWHYISKGLETIKGAASTNLSISWVGYCEKKIWEHISPSGGSET